MKKQVHNSCLFLDRDGVINDDLGHVYKREDINFIPKIFDLVKEANLLNILVIVITNQAGIAKGFYKEEDFFELTDWMKKQFIKNDCFLNAVYHCPYHSDAKIERYKKISFDRKPNPGMLLRAAKDYSISLNNSMIIGDNISDMIAGKRSGLKYNLLYKKNSSGNYFVNISDLKDAIKYLKKLGE